ncbi:MAG TPA: hypothetical protein VIZ28_18450 [Chitinophagaceae bacterium]
MKKLFIGLLIIAAGAGTYFFLQNKKPSVENNIQKELVTGKWKLNSFESMPNDSSINVSVLLAAMESNFMKYRYDFKPGGNILRSVSDSAKADTSYYEWTKDNQLAWKENAADSTGELFSVMKLTNDSLLLLSGDSATLLFTKLK